MLKPKRFAPWLRRARTAPSSGGLGLGQQAFMLFAVIAILIVGSGVLTAMVVGDQLVQRSAEDRVESMAWTVAAMREVVGAFDQPNPAGALQPLAEEIRERSGVSFVVLMTPDGTRYSHPNPERIGGHFVGTYEPAVRGEVVIENYEGTLGPSVRAVVPVRDDEGTTVGLAAVGVLLDQNRAELARAWPWLLLTAALSLLVAAGGSWFISRRLARQTFGMREAELAQVFAHHGAVLHGIREGLVVVDADDRVVLINDAAAELLGVGDHVVGRPVADLPVANDLVRRITSGEAVEDEVHLAGERLILVSQVPVTAPDGADLGIALTMRDHSELMTLAEELGATRRLADGLRAQVHESANRLHSIVMLVQLGKTDEAIRLATQEARAQKELTNRLVSKIEEPVLVALLLGKVAEAQGRSVELVVSDDSRQTGDFPNPEDLITILGNLVDNAMHAAASVPGPRQVLVTICEQGEELVVTVRDSGPGFTPEALRRVFEPGWSTKPVDPERRHGRGVGMALVQQVVTRRGGGIEVGNADEDEEADLNGAVVTVRLPLPPDPAGVTDVADIAEGNGRGRARTRTPRRH